MPSFSMTTKLKQSTKLVPVSREVHESGLFLLGGCLVDAAKRSGEQLFSHAHRQIVAHARVAMSAHIEERDCLSDDVIGRDEQLAQALAVVAVQHLANTVMVLVVLAHVCEEETSVEKNHFPCSP